MRDKSKVRFIFYIDPAERNALKRISTKTGAPVAELIRRAISDWLKRQGKGASK